MDEMRIDLFLRRDAMVEAARHVAHAADLLAEMARDIEAEAFGLGDDLLALTSAVASINDTEKTVAGALKQARKSLIWAATGEPSI